MNIYYKFLGFSLIITFFSQCQTPYYAPVNSSGTGYLVVEGYLDGNSQTVIKLTRTRTLSDTSSPISETGAKVLVEDNQGGIVLLPEISPGIYQAKHLILDTQFEYRVEVNTLNGEDYLSDFVRVKIAPPIDSITWAFNNNEIQIFVNTHDPSNETKYFSWKYNETWEVQSHYESFYKYVYNVYTGVGNVYPRLNQVYNCWPYDSSENILLNSTSQLDRDIISKYPLSTISYHDPRISVLYSILVTQFAMDTAGYNYFLALKNNTEKIGSIFDPQPSGQTGNIHCLTHPLEQVIGYIGAGLSSKSRIFIKNQDLPPDWNIIPQCDFRVVPGNQDSMKLYFGAEGYDPIDVVVGNYTAAQATCVDCTLFGTNVRPDFWP